MPATAVVPPASTTSTPGPGSGASSAGPSQPTRPSVTRIAISGASALLVWSTMAQPRYRVLVTATPRSARARVLLLSGGRSQESIGGGSGGGQPPSLWGGRAGLSTCAYVDRWHPWPRG